MNDEPRVRIIPLGGLGEIGMNMILLDTGEDVLVVDAGLMFPEEQMLGIDLVVPEVAFLLEQRSRVRGILLTHGHEDHTGALPYLLPQLPVPVYGTSLALGFVQEKLREFGLDRSADLRAVRPRDVITLGGTAVEFIRVSHSIPDGVAVAVQTPAGRIVHTGDFKFDQAPVDGELTDYQRLAQLGEAGVLLLLSDSTNAMREGFTPSESEIGKSFEQLFRSARRRIIVACFASNIHRIQQVLDVAARLGKKVAVNGKSMLSNTRIAADLGYLRIPLDTLVRLDDLARLPPDRSVIITTGSQGEPLSAMARMAVGEHKQLEVEPGDTVIFSARVIPGNEQSIARTVNQLFKRGAEVITEEILPGVHVSGHPSREELRLMLNLTRPRFFAPIHGEYRHLHAHARLARETGLPAERIFLLEDGDVLELSPTSGGVVGRAPTGRVLVDGKGVGDVGDTILRDRQHLAHDGMLVVVIGFDKAGNVVAGPDITSRGFAHLPEDDAIFEEARKLIMTVLDSVSVEEKTDFALIKQRVRSVLRRFLRRTVERHPMILPVIIEV
ncbi:MAG TPA: ribonuclease J [Candidatus Sulfotelmatobacter sp.]|nr:ribonuclease J [Candidatus Sulfotelmatobacter sp.]